MADITYCANGGCPFRDCDNHITNAPRNGPVSMAWLDKTCRLYIGWLVEKEKETVTNRNGFDNAGQRVTNALDGWISVKKALPEPFVSVLGYCPDEDPLPTVHECYMDGFGQWCSALVYGMEGVTHWMPMPEPPEEGHDGE